mmetsp:Transcript_47033/g.87364  ORF Transcript_47033/g.87364 Transcript_47033/m.87364 type:complete len:234 (+) Transcript_47033:55-756(+)
MAPIALSVNISKVQAFVDFLCDASDGRRDLARHEGPAATRALVIEKDTVRQMHPVRLAVIHQDPKCVLLGHCVRRARVEWSRLALGDLLHLAVQLRCRGLVESHLLLHAACADRVEHSKDAHAVTVGSVLWHVKGDLDVRHGSKVVNFRRTDLGNDGDEIGGIAEVAIVKVELDASLVAVLVDVVDTAGVEGRGAADDAVNLVSLVNQQLGQIGSILSSDPSDERNLPRGRIV